MTADRLAQSPTRDSFSPRRSDGAPVGYIKLGPPAVPVGTPPDTIGLCQFYILPAWQGAGAARVLMDWALATAVERGAKHIQLSVFIDNHRARRFYERYGFTAVGRYDFMVGTHADEDIVLRHVVLDVAPERRGVRAAIGAVARIPRPSRGRCDGDWRGKVGDGHSDDRGAMRRSRRR